MKHITWMLILTLLTITTLATTSTAQNDEEVPTFTGMDENVNENLAAEAGLSAQDPFINLEALGEVWSMILLLAGGVCGFILGRNWDLLWGKKSKANSQNPNSDEGQNSL